jgi:NADPH:quinone reductase-like Zn-dependent oxidoreductase
VLDRVVGRRRKTDMAAATTPAHHGTPVGAHDGKMRAVVQREYGTADVLHLDRIDRPQIAPDEVLVEVRAAGLDRGTWHLMTGVPYAARLAFGLRAPRNPVPGVDLAGVVVAVGPKVIGFRPGDEVYGVGKGSFAEFAAASESKLAFKPARLTFEQAAAVPVSGLTAQQGLLEAGRLQPGQHVLITGASGGVGSYAVQIAKAHGAIVTGVCSAAKMDLVRSLGADHVIDYTTTDFAAGDQRYDLILDIGGSASLRRLRSVLTERGTLVIAGAEGGGRLLGVGRQLRAVALSPFVRHRLTMLVAKDHHVPLERLTKLIDDGLVTPSVERVYPLAEAAEAMRRLEAGKVRGKLVVAP